MTDVQLAEHGACIQPLVWVRATERKALVLLVGIHQNYCIPFGPTECSDLCKRRLKNVFAFWAADVVDHAGSGQS